MPAVGKVTERIVGDEIVVSDESGESYTFKATGKRPLLLDVDPRIDLTLPIYEQVMKLAELDRTAQEKSGKRKRHVRAA